MIAHLPLTPGQPALLREALLEAADRRQRTALAAAPDLADRKRAGIDVRSAAVRLLDVLDQAATLTALADGVLDGPPVTATSLAGAWEPAEHQDLAPAGEWATLEAEQRDLQRDLDRAAAWRGPTSVPPASDVTVTTPLDVEIAPLSDHEQAALADAFATLNDNVTAHLTAQHDHQDAP